MPPIISLKLWAAKNRVPYRTALQWAKSKKIPAKMETTSRKLTITRKVRQYVVFSTTELPA